MADRQDDRYALDDSGDLPGCGAETIDQRRAVRDAVRYSVGVRFIARTETKIGPVYELTGQAMPRVVLIDAERKERQRERDAGRARSRRRPQQQAVSAPKRSRCPRGDASREHAGTERCEVSAASGYD